MGFLLKGMKTPRHMMLGRGVSPFGKKPYEKPCSKNQGGTL
jgi:hypothetical protein